MIHATRPAKRVLLLTSLIASGCLSSGCTMPGAAPNGNDNGSPPPGGSGNDNANVNTNNNGNGSQADFVFAVIGDYGDDDDDTRAVADMIKGWDPDFIITVGDNDYSDGAFRGTFEGLELAVGQYFHDFIGNYQGASGPGSDQNRFFPTPGDHDWGDTCDDPTGLDDYLRYFTLPDDGPGGERYYEFQHETIHFFSIHSLDGCEPDGVTEDSPQADWVRQTALASDAPLKIAYFHNPPYSSGANHVGDGEHMRWPWRDWGFNLIFSGDDHIYERIERDGVTYIVCGLGGVDIHPLLDTPTQGSLVRFNGDHGAMRIDVAGDRLNAQFITVAGTIIDEFTIEIPDQSGGSGGSTEPPGAGLDPDVPPVTQGNWYKPTVDTTWQWQLQPGPDGQINTSYDADVYDLDLFDVPASVIDALHDQGRFVICYFSAGSYEDFRADAAEFIPADLGTTLEGFADERWLDIRSTNVHRIMQARLDLAVQKGCDGVEPDNVTGFTNDTGFDLTADDQLAFNRFIANEAHTRDLSVGLKNDLEQVNDLLAYFDFQVNEQCHEFDECDTLLPFIDAAKPVFNAEYLQDFVDNPQARADVCADAQDLNLRTLILPVDLDDSFRLSCDSD